MHPKFDRTKRKLNFRKTAEDESLDIGWGEGMMNGRRPWYAEVWAEDQATYVTFFFSAQNIETISEAVVKRMLLGNGLVTFRGAKEYVGIRLIDDDSGAKFWSATVIIGDEDEMFSDTFFPVLPYRRPKPETEQTT